MPGGHANRSFRRAALHCPTGLRLRGGTPAAGRKPWRQHHVSATLRTYRCAGGGNGGALDGRTGQGAAFPAATPANASGFPPAGASDATPGRAILDGQASLHPAAAHPDSPGQHRLVALARGPSPQPLAPPVVNRTWARPAANLVSRRNTATDRGNTTSNRRPDYGRDDYDWRHRALYAWGGYASSSYYPYYSNYDPYYGYYPYGDSGNSSYPYADSYLPSGSSSDSEGAGASYQTATYSSASSNESAASTDTEKAAARYMGMARRAFQNGDYAEAQKKCARAIRLLPDDANLHQFGALCLFAQGKYKDTAATLYDVLAAGPAWDWNTLSSFYTSARTYTSQLRALERYVRENPKDAAGCFVLAYQYLVLEDLDATAGQFREATRLAPGIRSRPPSSRRWRS